MREGEGWICQLKRAWNIPCLVEHRQRAWWPDDWSIPSPQDLKFLTNTQDIPPFHSDNSPCEKLPVLLSIIITTPSGMYVCVYCGHFRCLHVCGWSSGWRNVIMAPSHLSNYIQLWNQQPHGHQRFAQVLLWMLYQDKASYYFHGIAHTRSNLTAISISKWTDNKIYLCSTSWLISNIVRFLPHPRE